MKLDATDLRYILPEEFRILKAVEQGSRAHHVVPASVIAQLSGLQHSGLNKVMGSLAKRNLIAREQHIKYDGYRLTYGGYDFLAVRALKEKEHVEAVGHRVGVGKESDIYLVSAGAPDYENRILKIHRLGRISFRAVKEKRDYTNKNANRQNFSWMFLSRLAAAKEYQFMQALHEHGFPVPIPYGQSRHSVVMSLIGAYPLRQIAEIPKDQIPLLYSALMSLIVRLGKAGLIHGDFNEFNLLIREKRTPEEDEHEQPHDPFKQYPSNGPFGQKVGTEPPPQLAEGEKWEEGKGFARVVATAATSANGGPSNGSDDEDEEPQESEDEDAVNQDESPIHLSDGATVEPILIDFPQMISVLHPNADYYFNRDVQCVRRFFRRRFRFISEEFPKFRDVRPGDVKEVPPSSDKMAGEEASLDDDNADLGVYLDLDVLTKASGYLTEVKKRGEYEELDQYMARMRMDGSGDEGLSEDDEEEEESEEDEEAEEDDLEGQGANGESKALDLMPPSEVDPPLGPRCKRKPAATKVVDEEEIGSHAKLIAQRIANERSTRKKQELKHHSKGKTGRTHPGGKGRSESVKDASVF
ncbi:hypothetical protein BCV69DRAFT_290326 [Microstroma glucosiphilum]|uniref:Serine/threonine-protein kinase RIO2 n=1 Tax=Pseudomicrostroma glucosiphilum TaxID=1684307 RepID=A0A316U8E4_9BASI|nr:hypothetical protein BCV69DRAFT_290326 [Pseudomicrostroma glucosiphilum]PWN20643.1 hypothetical protein BCV69DRAFT_290326 [Pseudomicrostroma glucosiphilum]